MENAKDNMFNISYNEKLDKLEKETSHKRLGLLKYISRNKFIIGIIAAFVFFSWLNLLLIYKFYKIIELFA